MGLFAFNNKNQTQPSYFALLLSEACEQMMCVSGSVAMFTGTSGQRPGRQVKTGFVPGRKANDIYLQPYPPFKGDGKHHPTNEQSAPGSLCPGQEPSYLVISLSDARGETEEENRTCPRSLSGCVIPGEPQVLTGLISLICKMRGLVPSRGR